MERAREGNILALTHSSWCALLAWPAQTIKKDITKQKNKNFLIILIFFNMNRGVSRMRKDELISWFCDTKN